ncbi:peptidase C1B bleomycin hydrolase [Thelephora terrestris]|uniref:Cysteine proteinase 1, mitochondrial n=1 Tax=Thelephora terrestris TaxID=56493 RepID=A0A9P6LB59_9AGAM|nr:peptidase C1B bleomycin hydrolase [Thelephora terrestris]
MDTRPTNPNATDAAWSASGALVQTLIENWESQIVSDPRIRLSRTVLASNDIHSSLLNRTAQISDPHVFNHVIDFKTSPRTDQKSSGRCWLFATTNVLRYQVMTKLNISEFELSQSYLFFWDKLHKANYYLELAIENAEKPLDDRLIYFLSDTANLSRDGGQWDMVVNILEQYGVVPKNIYPESYSSSYSRPLNELLQTKLREHAMILRELYTSLKADNPNREVSLTTVRARKEELMKEVYTIITATLGVPPPANEKFVYDYYDKDNKSIKWVGTPVEFYRNVASGDYPPSDSFSVINDPRNEYGKLYTVEKLGNVWGGRPVLYVNTEINTLKNTVVELIKAGIPVFFGCHVEKHSSSTLGIMDLNLFDYETAFNIKFGLTKKQRLESRDSDMTHAMVICGVHIDLDTGKPVRYKVENSWGDTSGDKGWFMMTDDWFSEYVYQIVVPKALAPKDLVKVYEDGNPTVLAAWDPMGALA